MKVLGMISGTSHDGIDVAVVDFPLDGDVLPGDRPALGQRAVRRAALRAHIVRTLPPAELRYSDVCELDTQIGQAFAEVAAEAIDGGRAGRPDLLPRPDRVPLGRRARTPWARSSSGQPAWIAERTGVPVVADVRARDITAGGHGAPLVSLMDVLLLGDLPGQPAALNLGGISNMTVLRHAGRPDRLRHRAGQRADRRRASGTDRRAAGLRRRWAIWPLPARSTPASWQSCSRALLRAAGAAVDRQGAVQRRLPGRRSGTPPGAVGARPAGHAHRADRPDGRRRGRAGRASTPWSAPVAAATTRR